ncbi:MAG: hypothetical protein ACR2JW_11780 [Thermomicrobiales bacterium]
MAAPMKHSAVKEVKTDERTVARTMAEALRETELTAEEAEELRRRLEQPRILPAREPRDLPAMDPSHLRP